MSFYKQNSELITVNISGAWDPSIRIEPPAILPADKKLKQKMPEKFEEVCDFEHKMAAAAAAGIAHFRERGSGIKTFHFGKEIMCFCRQMSFKKLLN